MNLTKEQLSALEDYAYNLICLDLAAIMMEVDEMDLREAIEQPDTPEHRAYYKGYGRMLIETRKQVIKSAQNGSNPAQMQLLQFIKEFQNDKNSFS